MHPTTARSNRSSLQSLIPPTSTSSSALHPQQQQILYGPIANPMLTLQPCGTGLHPSCIYPGIQRNAALPSPVPLYIQGKSSRWPPKNKLVRSQQYYQQQQQHIQQQLSYNPKPLILFDQTTNSGPPPAPTTSFLVASSTYTHGSFSGDQYSNSGVTLIPQPYFKPPDVQTFCLLQDRQTAQPAQQQEQPSHGSYYNISATNTCNLQTINANSTFQFPSLNPYAPTANFTNQISGPIQTVQPTQIFPNLPASLNFGGLQSEKPTSSPAAIDISAFESTKSKVSSVNNSQIAPITSESYSEWPCQTIASSSNSLFNLKPSTDDTNQDTISNSLQKVTSNVSTKTQEEHYSDESTASFDFAIEAEKMVSALCNTSLNDLGKEETTKNNKSTPAPLFNGAGDTVSNKHAWFTDFSGDYETRSSIAVQTDGPCVDRRQYPEILRKIVYWGCSEAEIVLNNSAKLNSRYDWLRNLSLATKTAIRKSSTCFPIFAGDRIFVSDLINALLRISNGWLILDNYLNKQHYPSLDDKFNRELTRCFQLWEESTHELLNQIVQTFMKLEENNDSSSLEQKSESFVTSFPGDVSVYTNCDLFDPSTNMNTPQQESGRKKNDQDPPFNVTQLATESLRNLDIYNIQQEKQSSQKGSKLRSKWTVTENLTTVDSTKTMPDMFLGHAEIGVQASSRFRTRRSSSSTKIDMSTQSLNAEFFQLRSKVLTEHNRDSSRQWMFKEKKHDFLENNAQPAENADSIFRLQRQMDENYENNYGQKCFSRVQSSFTDPPIDVQSMYFTSTNESENFHPTYALYPSYMMDYGNKNVKAFNQNHGNKTNMDLVYIGKSSTSQLELAAVPKDKMTLLSQIEPSLPDKSSEEMTANLSAWFASMRNSDNRHAPFMNFEESKTANVMSRLPSRQEIPKNTMDLTNCIRQLQIDANRQFQTLQNMQSIQSAPWNTYNLINNRIQVQQVPEEYDSSEDVRVYMKPGSYNVPKKRHQRRSNRRSDNSISRNVDNGSANNNRNHYTHKEKTFCAPASSTPVPRTTASSILTSVSNLTNATMKLPFPATPIVPPPTFSLENSPRILKRTNTPNYTMSQDVTWKAACASAEILLDALNVKEDTDSKDKEISCIDAAEEEDDNARKTDGNDTATQSTQSQGKLKESLSKNFREDNNGCGGASSYEASEDDSGSTSRFPPSTSVNEVSQSSENKSGSSKTNVKTDSWLIRTLNKASMVNKQKKRKNGTDPHSSESSNSSGVEDEQATPGIPLETDGTAIAAATTTTVKNFQQMICSRQTSCTPLSNNRVTSEETEQIVAKATYSETVRRCTPLSLSHSDKQEFCKKSKLNVANASAIYSTIIPVPGRRCQRKDSERSYYLLHNRSRKNSGKKDTKNCETDDHQTEEICSKPKSSWNEMIKENSSAVPSVTSKSAITTKHGKKKENVGCIELLDHKFAGKTNDRGWSVWYSSKRKQSLSPLALSKLETIYQTVWQMEDADIFKCPSSGTNGGCLSSAHTIEDYCKVVKSPMFLETVDYKLKNRVYHKVEHAVRDFRRIVYNSKLYHKDDHDRAKTIETLSKKLEELFEEHFASWDFDNISGSPRGGSPMPHRVKSTGQKSLVPGRHGNTKKSPSPSVTENV